MNLQISTRGGNSNLGTVPLPSVDEVVGVSR